MQKLKAIEAFEDQDGKFAADDEFEVNDERAFVLLRTGKAERVATTVAVEMPEVEAAPQFRVPQRPVE